jgi:hypothetical protein
MTPAGLHHALQAVANADVEMRELTAPEQVHERLAIEQSSGPGPSGAAPAAVTPHPTDAHTEQAVSEDELYIPGNPWKGGPQEGSVPGRPADSEPHPTEPRTGGYCRTRHQPERVPLRLAPRPVARVPFNIVPRWTEVLEHKLEAVVSAHQSGNEHRLARSIDDLSGLASAALADSGGSRGRAGRTAGRLDRLEDTDEMGEAADEVPPTSPPKAPSPEASLPTQHPAQGRTRPASATSEAQRMASQIQHHLAYGAVGRAARSLDPVPPVELTEENIRKLHDLHPASETPHPPRTFPDAIQIDRSVLLQIVRHYPRGSAAGPTGTTYEHLMAGFRSSDKCLDLGVEFINLLLRGELPRCESLLDSRLIALSKPRTDGRPPGVRPIAVGEVWLRLASLCALAKVSHVGASLAPLQLGVGVRGGCQALGHACVPVPRPRTTS